MTGTFSINSWSLGKDHWGVRIELSSFKYNEDCKTVDKNYCLLFTIWHRVIKIEFVTDRKQVQEYDKREILRARDTD